MTRFGSTRSGLTRVALALAAVAATAMVMVVAQSRPAAADSTVDAAVAALQTATVYNDPAASPRLTDAQVTSLEQQIASAGTPIWVAILPASVLASYGGDWHNVVQAIQQGTGQSGTFALVTGHSFHADDNVGKNVASIATQAVQNNTNLYDVLTSFVSGMASAYGTRSSSGGSSGSSGPGVGGVLVFGALIAAGGGAITIAVRRSSQRAKARAAANLAEVRPTFEEDVTALGEDIEALDLDIDAATTTDAMRERYAGALNAYDAAKQALDRATSTIDLPAVTAALEEGRYALACVRALQAGQPEPQRLAPCFFNPQHGPSVQVVSWTPAGGTAREVPVCADCADRLSRGQEVDARTVQVGGASTPYWNAGPQYAGYAGGYYNGFGGILPGLLLGTVLGSSMGGGWGGGWGGGDWGGGGDGDGGGWTGGGGGDFGGGGGGDFGGGGGGDFGGGGGGDFGGGGGGSF